MPEDIAELQGPRSEAYSDLQLSKSSPRSRVEANLGTASVALGNFVPGDISDAKGDTSRPLSMVSLSDGSSSPDLPSCATISLRASSCESDGELTPACCRVRPTGLGANVVRARRWNKARPVHAPLPPVSAGLETHVAARFPVAKEEVCTDKPATAEDDDCLDQNYGSIPIPGNTSDPGNSGERAHMEIDDKHRH